MEEVLKVKNLHVSFATYGGEVHAVRGVHFELYKGETLAIVGESGCGKSVTSQSIMGLISKESGSVKQGSVIFKGRDLAKLSEKEMRSIRGREISMIFQDPMTALNPTLSVGDQLIEAITQHQTMFKREAKQKVVNMLDLVGIPNPRERFNHYPHQFSGGMRQRIVIAMALICQPEIMIADEPTTALDVTIQAQIFELFKEIQQKIGISIILITHNLGIVAQAADRIAVMYAGKVVETGTRRDIFYQPQHPYTKGLLNSVPRLDLEEEQLISIPGSPPDLFSPPEGCPFAARCPCTMEICDRFYPFTTQLSVQHQVNCWLQDKRAQQRKHISASSLK